MDRDLPKLIKPKDLFFPNKAIRSENKRFFAGRKNILDDATRRVGDDGFSAIVFGERGVGKTSFGWQLMQRLSQIGFKCIWFQCSSKSNLKDVLSSILKESLDDYSYKSHFPQLYVNSQDRDTIQRKYGFNLGIISSELTFKRDESKPHLARSLEDLDLSIEDLFKDVLTVCKSLCPSDDIVIFLDEFDSLLDTTGIGQMIKGVDNAKFVIIGIADDINEIIADHPSAERKLANSKFKIPKFEYSEVLSLFDIAEAEAQGQVVFDLGFRESVYSKSNGYPFLIQQFGYFAMQAAQDAHPSASKLVVSVDYLDQAIKGLFQGKAENTMFIPLFNVLNGDGQAKREILRLIADANIQQTSDVIKKNVSPRLKQHIEANLRQLVVDKILKATEDFYRFANPEAKILTNLYFSENP